MKKRYKYFLLIVLLWSVCVSLKAQSASFANIFLHAACNAVVHNSNHNFTANGIGPLNGIVGTERTNPRGFLGFAGTASWSGANNAQHVDGYVRTYMTSSFIFPIGDNGQYRPCGIGGASATQPADAAYFGVNPSTAITSSLKGGNEPPLPSGTYNINNLDRCVGNVSNTEYWDINGQLSTNITLTWGGSSAISSITGGVLSKLSIAGWDGSKWVNIPSAVDATSILGGTSNMTTGSITTTVQIVPNSFDVYTFSIKLDPSTKDSFRTICRYQPIVFNGNTINTTGVYRDTFTNAQGCDSFLVLHLTVNDSSRKDSFKTICRYQPIVFNGNTINTTGIYRDTFTNAKGCDSFLVLHLTVNDTSRKDSFKTICKNQPITFNGNVINTSGIYKDTLINSQGCDSFIYLNLTVKDTTRKDSFRTICKNQPIVFNGNTINTSGIYRDTFVNTQGCDSFLVLNLTVKDTSRFVFQKNICQGDSFKFNQITHYTGGVFKDTLVNAAGCDSFVYLQLIVDPLPIANAGLDQTRVNCNGDSVRIGSPALANHAYLWSPNINLDNLTTAQTWSKTTDTTTYYLMVVNTLTNCKNYDTTTIYTIESQLAFDTTLTNLKCYGIPEGKINIQAKQGYPPYQYKLSLTPFQSAGLFINLPSGLDKFTIVDSKGCSIIDSFRLSQPSKMILDSISKKNLTCYQSNDGEIEVKISGGIAPYTYSWSNSPLNSPNISNLIAGVHKLTVVDNNGCSLDTNTILIEPKKIIVKDSVIKPNPCYGDTLASIEVLIDGGTQPYTTYNWSNGKQGSKITNLKQNTYTLTVIDSKNCSESFKFTGLSKDIDSLVFLTKSVTEFECSVLGFLNLLGNGGKQPYLYSIDSGISFSNRNRIQIDEPKIYNLGIRDANGCLTHDTILVRGTNQIEVQISPKDTTVEVGEPVKLSFVYTKGDSSKVHSFVWKPSTGLSCSDCREPVATPYAPTKYQLEISYSDNCKYIDTCRIWHKLDELFIPNSFSPASDNIENQTFKVYSKNILQAKLQIFNRWGEKVYETNEAHKVGWDGTYKGELLNSGIYTYVAEIIYLDGRKVFSANSLTLIR